MVDNFNGEAKYREGRAYDARWDWEKRSDGDKIQLRVSFETRNPETEEEITATFFMRFTWFNPETKRNEPLRAVARSIRDKELDAMGAVYKEDPKTLERAYVIGTITRETPREKVAAMLPKLVSLKLVKKVSEKGEFWNVDSLRSTLRTVQIADDHEPAPGQVEGFLRHPVPVLAAGSTVGMPSGKLNDEEIPF